ncbi:FAD-binding oxidoreductase [Phycisphaerales bacterium AB-hyl4]|uniref:FAD-binding oxidoreductase n=1 Tax=Natronomicrosphaera hydrolytica TaxID=3242702 RepID=A0ABV4U3P5_9BACT
MSLSDGVKPDLQLENLVASLADIVGQEHVLIDGPTLDRYARSSSGNPTRPLALVRPADTEQVQRLVQLAVDAGLALHPIARGRNWGYGDACAPTQNQVVVDMARMNRIVEVNRRLAYTVIEPGVSQGQLWQYLQQYAPDLMMDCTGAGPDASLVGNTLDRGFGHTRYGDHFLTTCGMQVVLPDGRVLETGFGHYSPKPHAQHVYRYGIGPFLDGLFVQSNFGIVTRIGLWLMPKPEAFSAFFFSDPNPQAIEKIVESLAPLRMQGLLTSAIHIGNDLRLLSARTRYPWERAQGKTPLSDDLRKQLCSEFGIAAWTGCGAISGTRETVAATKKAVRRAVRTHTLVFLDDQRIRRLDQVSQWLGRLGLAGGLRTKLASIRPIYGLLKGEPTSESIAGTAWRVRGPVSEPIESPLDAHAGIIWASPVIPATGDDARRLLDLMEPIYKKHGFEMLVTFTMINERAMVAVTNLAFDAREADEARQAADCYHELTTTMLANGYPPYRSSPLGQRHLRHGSEVYWDVVDQLRQMLDPRGIVSPGRYEPPLPSASSSSGSANDEQDM